ncbi:MAG: riboflavin synthase [Phycisphaerae bacterium]|nr:riboflavin synthase [Phycisphaerae bacterium]NIS53731.1 riboflavin synthase [Phycisphaerae bacterium]NIU11310.1 riboflavin synthase [Phycisphaerae bacterium]NIU59124.1 riboflavin synthase [Phycisphaerae bacterium]NIW93885.1 riboflavin synthase [Phycisphaerae bacterium]
MFTGLIEQVCRIQAVRPSAGAVKLTIDLGKLADECKIGDSVAVSGVCLTVSWLEGNLVRFDVSGETLAKSNLTRLTAGSKVNIELAMKIGDRFGGHIVQGHVDGVAKIKTIERGGEFVDIRFEAEGELLDRMVVKGSVAVDGISLTIASMDGNSFSVAVIPETLKRTTLGEAKTGDMVNIETDIITRTIKKQLEKLLPQKQTLTEDKLKQLGF